jgi:hypothetical protein
MVHVLDFVDREVRPAPPSGAMSDLAVMCAGVALIGWATAPSPTSGFARVDDLPSHADSTATDTTTSNKGPPAGDMGWPL